MASVKDIIEINISRETRGVSRQGFGTPLFIGETTGVIGYTERVRTYTSSEAVLEDFAEGDPEYTAALRFFGQQLEPTVIKIGYYDPTATTSVDFVVTAADATTYDVTVDSVPFSFTSGAGATAQEIVDGLEADFTAQSVPGTFVDNSDGTFTILPDDPANFTYSTNTAELADTENLENLSDAYQAIKAVDDDFYFVTAESHTQNDVEALAAVIETESKIFVTSTSASDATDPLIDTDVGSTLQALNYARTAVIYAEDDTQYPECAIIGLQAPKDPGSTTWKFKTVTGVTASNLTTTQSLTLKGSKFDFGKGYNTIEPTGGRDIFAEGRMVNSEFIDIIRFADWLEARMRERIYLTLVNSEKIPYTAAGFAIIEGRMREVLNNGVVVGGILPNYNITVPNPRSLDPNERINRVASGFTFEATLAGAVHFVEISGNLVV